jgi:hypothetical protein
VSDDLDECGIVFPVGGFGNILFLNGRPRMAVLTSEWFDETTKGRMRSFFGTLSEKDQRRYAALEAQRLGHGGIKYISEVLGCSTKTIRRGVDELDMLDNDPAAGRIRRPGAGRKKTFRLTPKSNGI